ncbi:MAG: hypothetical protein QNL32_03615 [Actinomycetes bacterium]
MNKVRIGWALIALIPLLIANPPAVKAEPGWTKIYETITPYRNSTGATAAMTYVSGFGKTGGAADAFVAAGTEWDLIKIRMEMTLKSNSVKYFAEAYFDKWSGATISGLKLPDHLDTNIIQRNITNLVVTSDYSGVKTGSFALGRLEMWPYNYSPATSPSPSLSPVGDAAKYDWDDSISIVSNGHGSFQVHNLTDTQTIMAWNMHRPTINAQDLGLGPGPAAYPDWTAQANLSWSATDFKVQIFVGASITTSTINAPIASGAQLKSKSTTLQATTSIAGKVTFYSGTKRIPGCASRSTVDVSGTQTATCVFKPNTSGQLKYWARLIPSSSSYTGSTSPATVVQIGRRTGPR